MAQNLKKTNFEYGITICKIVFSILIALGFHLILFSLLNTFVQNSGFNGIVFLPLLFVFSYAGHPIISLIIFRILKLKYAIVISILSSLTLYAYLILLPISPDSGFPILYAIKQAIIFGVACIIYNSLLFFGVRYKQR